MKMRRTIWLILAVAVYTIRAAVSQANTNSCVSATDGFWDEARIWSLNKPPSIHQSAVLITNAASETITIDSTTAQHFKSTLTISNLDVSPYQGSTDTLYLDNTGTIALHILDGLTIALRPDYPYGGEGQLFSTNSTLIVDGLLGGQLQDNGTMVIAGGSLITTNCSLYVAGSISSPFNTLGLLILSNAVVQARDVTIASASPSIGMLELIGGTMTMSSSLNIGTGEDHARGTLLVADGALLVVTNAGISTFEWGPASQSGGSITVSNATMLAASWFGGDLSVESGTVTLQGSLIMDYAELSLDGGKLVITNDSTTIGWYMSGSGLTIEDGLFLAQEILVGAVDQSGGVLTVNGGTTQLSSYLQVGGFGFSYGAVFVNGGQLVVTNGETILTKYGASMTVTGGLLAADYIVMGAGQVENGVGAVPAVLSVTGGSITASTGITLGDCAFDGVGQIFQTSGRLIVTNAAHTAFIDVQSGQLVLSGGVLQVDKLVMTNACSSFIHTGGKLIVSSVVLDPNAFQIVSVTPQGKDILVSWLMAPGSTNALQVSSGGGHGKYVTNNFTDIFVVTNNTTAGTFTNYLDVGAATNFPSRYYRARLSP
jgi:hypothetical protein